MPAKGIMKKEQNINIEKEGDDTDHIYEDIPAEGTIRTEQNIDIEKEGDDTEHIYEEISSVSSPNVSFSDSTVTQITFCLLYTSPSPRDLSTSRMPSSA